MNVQSPHLTTPHRAWLRIEDFLLLNDNGAFADFSKTELIDGEILCMNSQFQRHSYVKSQLAFRLDRAIAKQWPGLLVLVEAAVAMPPHDMPEPDIIVMRGPIGNGAVDVGQMVLVVEVADTTLAIDLGRKARLYARHGVAEYWVVDIAGQRIVSHTVPMTEGYAEVRDTAFGSVMAATTIGGLAIETSRLA